MSLPPGVTDSMIPGNTPEDREWNDMIDALSPEANALVVSAKGLVASAKHVKHVSGFGVVEALIADALEEEGVMVIG